MPPGACRFTVSSMPAMAWTRTLSVDSMIWPLFRWSTSICCALPVIGCLRKIPRAHLVPILTSGSTGEPYRFWIGQRHDQWRKAQYLRPYLVQRTAAAPQGIAADGICVATQTLVQHTGVVARMAARLRHPPATDPRAVAGAPAVHSAGVSIEPACACTVLRGALGEPRSGPALRLHGLRDAQAGDARAHAWCLRHGPDRRLRHL